MKFKLSKTFIYTSLILIALFLCYKNIYEITKYIIPEESRKEILEYKSYIDNKVYNKLLKRGLLNNTYTTEQIDEYVKQEGFNFKEENKKNIIDSLSKLYDKNTYDKENLKIPAITHRVYFSSPSKPKKASILYVEMIKESVNKLNNLGIDWEHNLWTNMPELFPDELNNIKGIKIRNINELKNNKLYETLVKTVKKGDDLIGHFSEASDTLRFMVLDEFGGLYTDMDYEIYNAKPLFELMHKYDFIGVRGINLYYETGFMASKPNHPILNRAVYLEARNNGLVKNVNIPDAIKYPRDEYRRIYFSGPSLITVAYIDKNNINGNSDILLPYWMAFNSHLSQYKNGSCNYYNNVTTENFKSSTDNLQETIKNYIINYKKEYSTEYREGKILENYQQNIYYDPASYRNDFEIIGADMSCGTWSTENKGFDMKYYWKLPWTKNK